MDEQVIFFGSWPRRLEQGRISMPKKMTFGRKAVKKWKVLRVDRSGIRLIPDFSASPELVLDKKGRLFLSLGSRRAAGMEKAGRVIVRASRRGDFLIIKKRALRIVISRSIIV